MQMTSDWKKSSFSLTASLNVNMAGGEKQIVKFAKVISYPNSLTFLLSVHQFAKSIHSPIQIIEIGCSNHFHGHR